MSLFIPFQALKQHILLYGIVLLSSVIKTAILPRWAFGCAMIGESRQSAVMEIGQKQCIISNIIGNGWFDSPKAPLCPKHFSSEGYQILSPSFLMAEI